MNRNEHDRGQKFQIWRYKWRQRQRLNAFRQRSSSGAFLSTVLIIYSEKRVSKNIIGKNCRLYSYPCISIPGAKEAQTGQGHTGNAIFFLAWGEKRTQTMSAMVLAQENDEQVCPGWLWLVTGFHGSSRFHLVSYGWSWFAMISHSLPWLAMVCQGLPWLDMVGQGLPW